MKKFVLYTAFAALGLFGTTACSDFGDTNIDPEHFNDDNMEYDLMFTNAQHQALGSDWDVWRNGIIYGGTMMQHVTSVNWSHVFYTWTSDYNSAYWDAMYTGDRAAARDIKIVMEQWKDDPDYQVFDYQLARIVKAYVYHRLTDLYGDIPYTEAAAGIDYPKYDKQSDIYADILKELNEAQAALEGTSLAIVGKADIYYGGKVEYWKKFANSLMLRVAMRLTKVDPAMAEQWVKTAVSNGLFTSIDDNALLQHPEGDVNKDSSEPYAKIYSQSDPGKFFLSEYFVNLLKNTNDPRLALFGTVCEDPTLPYSSPSFEMGNSDPAIQVGMPAGYDLSGGDWDLSKAPNSPGDKFRSVYSVVNRYTFGDPKAPTLIVTYAENQLLLAEAALRGWLKGTSADKPAKEYYEEGVRAAMKQFSTYPNASALYGQYLTDTAIEQYLKENPFDESKAMEQIHTQYYIATFCDSYETFANWRRTGYPRLTPVNNEGYPNAVTNSEIPRRFTYPTAESAINPNYQEAVSRLAGGDKMTSRVWWDKE